MPEFSVSGGRLHADGAPVRYRATPNLGASTTPRFLIMHFTCGGYDGAIEWLCNPEAKASAHLVIGEHGEITQLAPFDRVTWHAGRSEWRGCTAMNTNSIGIELANYGELDGGPGHYSFAGHAVPDDRVVVARHANGGGPQPWHTFPLAQIETALAVAEALHRAYGFEDVAGHDQIAPGRKTDPGPAFDMVGFRAAVLGSRGTPRPVDNDQVRTWASEIEATLDHSPLALQRALNLLGFGPLDEDGDIGDKTRRATERFQAANGLEDDGDAGRKTWAAIDAAMAERRGGV